MNLNEKLSVVIGTCDSYIKYLPNCLTLLDKYFEPNIRKLIVSETESFEKQGYEWILPGKEQWGKRIGSGLKLINTEYVFFILEDYYISQKLSIDFFNWILTFMDREKANKIIFTTVPDWANYRYTQTIDTIKRMSPCSEWLTSAQPAIWKTNHILNNVVQDDYDPWDFEIKGSEKLKGRENSHFVVKLDEPIYFNFVRKGNVLSPGWEQFLRQEGLSL